MDQSDSDETPRVSLTAPSSIVDRLKARPANKLRRTAKPHGLSGREIGRHRRAVRFMELHCPRGSVLWWATTSKGTSRQVIASIQKRITKLQGEHQLPRYNTTAFEAGGDIHAHIIFVGTDDIAKRLKSSTAFGAALQAADAVARVTDAKGLTDEYLAKERTSSAGYGREHGLGGRIKGSHRLPGGGDRVRLSRDLERDAIEAGYVTDWLRTNAKRTETRKIYRLRNSGPLARAPQPAGQLSLLPEIDRPVSRLRDFGGGMMPRSVAAEIEFRRKQVGLSQRELGSLIGRSQGQYANACRGHDPISTTAVNRLREVLLFRRIPGQPPIEMG